MLSSNSQIFTDKVFGKSSGLTAEQLVARERQTQEALLGSSSASNMATELPQVPSNQRIARDKS